MTKDRAGNFNVWVPRHIADHVRKEAKMRGWTLRDYIEWLVKKDIERVHKKSRYKDTGLAALLSKSNEEEEHG